MFMMMPAPALPRRLFSMAVVAIALLALLLAQTVPAQAQSRNDDELLRALIAIGAIAIIADQFGGSKPAPVVPAAQPVVPTSCAIQIEADGRMVTVYSERCLREAHFTRRLPKQCAHNARIFGQADRIYPAACLRREGFKLHPKYR